MSKSKSSSGSLSSIAWRRLRKNYLAIGGLVFTVVVASLCFAAPLVTSYHYADQVLRDAALAPSAEHIFGTDLLGRDLLSRILYGGRISFLVGLVATLVSLTIGVTYGAFSGWLGGIPDRIMMRVVEIIYSLPYTIFVVILMVFVGRGLWPLFIAIGAVEWLTMARLVRGQVMVVKNMTYVHAAQVLGQSSSRIVTSHLLPNILSTIIICATLTIPNVMLLESLISFLGLGVQAPMTSWGDLIKEGSESLESAPWLIIFPSLFFSLTLFSLNFLGDGLRDALDPKSVEN